MAPIKKARSILIRTLGAAVTLLVLALLWLSLILGQPQNEKSAPVSQPFLSSVPAVNVSEEGGLPELLTDFPIPVLSFMSGSGMTFVNGITADLPLAGGFGRTVTLYWQTEAGLPVTLQSIYPASAINILKGNGYSFSTVAGPALAGIASVRMENEETERLHIQTEEGLYTVTVPRSLHSDLTVLAKSLQLFTADR